MIKLFEEYNEYYTQISYDEWSNKVGIITLSQSDKNIIHDIKIKGCKWISGRTNPCGSEYMTLVDNKKLKSSIILNVYKFEDEWFYITGILGYYKCDQRDGMIKCLENLLKDKLDYD